MHHYQNLLIVVADAGQARLVRPNEAHVLHTERRFESASAHKHSAELRSDRPGASYHSDSTAHHALAPRHDPHEQEKDAFARLIAAELNGLPPESFDGLVIAAPPHCLQEILDALTPPVRARLAGTLPKDLAKTPDDALSAHLQDFVPAPAPPRHK